MAKIQAPKGFEDVLPQDSWKWQAVERIAREVSELYHFQEVRTPVVETTELFHRGVGETSDIVHKETFTFNDRGGDSMTLRPEGTAGVVRAMIEHNVLAQEGSRAKVFYLAPNFRYERPQKGRLRQHHQFGAEAFGVASPDQDVECILLQMDFYRRCGVKDLELQINSLGDAESKQRYRDALVQFLTPKRNQLSEDSQRRLDSNPLRILDSKDPRDREAVEGVPPAHEFLSEKSRQHFERVQLLLRTSSRGLTVPYGGESEDAYYDKALNQMAPAMFKAEPRINPKLVRGFDYYTETLWEVTAGGLGSQNAIGGGGRYDNLVEMLGGRPTPGVGFGSGLERLLIALEAQGVHIPQHSKPLIWLVAVGDAAKEAVWQLLRELREAGISADADLSGRSPKAQFKIADREGAKFCLVIGDDELKNSTVVLKTFATAEQTAHPRAEIIAKLQALT